MRQFSVLWLAGICIASGGADANLSPILRAKEDVLGSKDFLTMKIAELCAWAGVAPDTPWERLEAALREKTLAWAGEGATLVLALEVGAKSHGEAEARLSDAKAKKVPPMSPVWRMAEADCKKWSQRLEVAKVLAEVERFREARAQLDQLIKDGKRNKAKLALDDLRAARERHPEILDRQWQEAEAEFLDAFGPVTPAAAAPATPPPTPAPALPPPPPAPIAGDVSRITPQPLPTDIEEQMRVGDTVRELRPGLRVFGRYRLEKVIGRGGMGVVWLARDERLERPVALKFLPEIVRLDERAVKELKRETQRSLELTHPHIVRIYDYVEDSELAAISMEYVDGPTLSALQARKGGGVFEVDELRGWVRQLGEALEFAHTKVEVVHRDLKPANLMVNSKGNLKVADFGISRSLSESFSRVSMGTGGTPMYMSPQQALGEKPSVADDVYGVGATLYELLTGKPPFYSGNIQAQLERVVPPLVSERQKDLGVKGASIPAEWDRAIAACLEKDPGKRPSSVRDVVERLERGEAAAALTRQEAPEPKPESVRAPEDRLPVRARTQTGQAGLPAPRASRQAGRPTEEEKIEAPRRKRAVPIGAVVLLLLMGCWAGWQFGVKPWQREKAAAEAKRLAEEKAAAEARAREEAAEAEVLRLDPGNAKVPVLKPTLERYLEPQPGESLTNSLGMVMIWVAPGEFDMGSPASEKDRERDETQHRVRLTKGYWLGRTEVTQGQWEGVMGSNPSRFKNAGKDAPVETVSWDDAMEYCRKLTERERGAGRLPEGYVYTLPTEAQWEYACRAGSSARFSYGDDPDYAQLGEYAWYVGNSSSQTHSVGTKRPNAWGFYDMHGNVWEWCLDWWGAYASGTVTDPTGVASGSNCVSRGGCWDYSPHVCRSAYCFRLEPGDRDSRVGFRAALVAVP